MNNSNKKCENCGELLQASQYARRKPEGEPSKKGDENLVCRNPDCSKAEKDCPIVD